MKQAILFFLLLFGFSAYAQDLKVKSFTRLERDLLARTDERLDLNDIPCAVVRISVQKANSFEFEGNVIGKPVYNPGEAIVWMASGSRNIMVKSEEFGTLRFEFPQKLEKSVVYELSLIVQQVATEQGLMMSHTPKEADIYIDDSLQTSRHDGFLSTVLPVGQHKYRVVANHYEEENGTLHIVPERMTALHVTLKPTYAFLKATSSKEKTKIFVNDSLVGEAPYVSDTISAGKYKVRTQRKWYLPQEQVVELAPTEVGDLNFDLEIQKGNIFLMGQWSQGSEEEKAKAWGAFLGICRKGGFYLSARFKNEPLFGDDYDVDNSYVLSSLAKTRHFSATGGLLLRLAQPVYLYLGSGYVWNFVEDEAAENTNSYNSDVPIVRFRGGVAADAGLIFRYRFLAVSAGYTHAFPISRGQQKYGELNIGFGFVLGRWKNK